MFNPGLRALDLESKDLAYWERQRKNYNAIFQAYYLILNDLPVQLTTRENRRFQTDIGWVLNTIEDKINELS